MSADEVLRPTNRPIYVLRMHWDRMGLKAKRRWVSNLMLASQTTVTTCQTWLHQNPESEFSL